MELINVNVYQLFEKLKNKKLVCFGAGKMLHNFIDMYKKIEYNVALILDNNKEKFNTSINIGNQTIDIISLEKFCANYQTEDFIILITCADIKSVYEQLQQIKQLKDVECCVSAWVTGMTNETDEKNRHYPKKLRIYDKPVIPKIIHYCWFGGKEIPEQNKVWMASWKKYCPDYEIIEWNESNYNVEKNTYIREAYQARKWAFVSDFARLDIIYHYGGIYLDTDVEIIKNLDELLYQDAFAGVTGTKNVSLGLGFGAKPKFELIKRLMNEYDARSFYYPNGIMDTTTLPQFMTLFLEKIGYKNNGEYQKLEGLTVYPEKVLSGKCNYTGRIMPTEKTFTIHHFDASWVPEELKIQGEEGKKLYQDSVL